MCIFATGYRFVTDTKLCGFCFPSKMINHNAPFFPDYKILGNFTEIKMLENTKAEAFLAPTKT